MARGQWERVPTEVGGPAGSAQRSGTALAYLVRLGGPSAGVRYPLESELLVGRDESSDIQLRTPDVSRRHARVARTGSGDYVLEDLGSKNGTLVNGTAVKLHLLRFGDTLHFGSRAAFIFTHHNPIEAEVIEAERLRSVAQMAGGIAHHFNNLMAVLVSNLGCLQDLPLTLTLGDPQVSEVVCDMQTAVGRASAIVQQLLAYARKSSRNEERVDVGALVRRVGEALGSEFGDTELWIDAELGLWAEGDELQLAMVVENLCRNAREAMRGPGRVELSARAIVLSPELAASRQVMAVGPHIEIRVTDCGEGMDLATQSRAFEPFFSTKGPTRGTGLGLAAVHGVLKDHGGHVSMESEVGRGTTFWVYLPTVLCAQPSSSTEEYPVAAEDDGVVLIAVGDARLQSRLRARVAVHGGNAVFVEGVRALILATIERRGVVKGAVLQMGDELDPESIRMLRAAKPNLELVIVGGESQRPGARTLLDAGAGSFYALTDDASDERLDEVLTPLL